MNWKTWTKQWAIIAGVCAILGAVLGALIVGPVGWAIGYNPINATLGGAIFGTGIGFGLTVMAAFDDLRELVSDPVSDDRK